MPLSAYAPLPASRLLHPRNAMIDPLPFSGFSDWLLIRINQMSLVQLRLEWWGGPWWWTGGGGGGGCLLVWWCPCEKPGNLQSGKGVQQVAANC